MLTETSKVASELNGVVQKERSSDEKTCTNEKMDVDEESGEARKRQKREAEVAVGTLCSVQFEDPIGWVKGTIVKLEEEEDESRKILVRYHRFVEEEWLEISSDSVRIHRIAPLRVRVENALMDEKLVSRSKTVTEYEKRRGTLLKKKEVSSSVKSLYNKIVWVRQQSFPWWPALVLDPELLFGEGWKMFKKCDSKSAVVVYLGWGDGFVFHKTPVVMGKTVMLYTRDEKDKKLRSGYMKPLSSSTSRTTKKKRSISPALKRQLDDISLPLADDWCQLSENQIVEGWKEHAGWFLDTRRACYDKLLEEFTEIITLELERENREYVLDRFFCLLLSTSYSSKHNNNSNQIHDDEKRRQARTFASCQSKKGETCNS